MKSTVVGTAKVLSHQDIIKTQQKRDIKDVETDGHQSVKDLPLLKSQGKEAVAMNEIKQKMRSGD